MAIKSFADKETEKIFARVRSSKLPQDMQQLAYRKLRILHNAYSIQDLRVPPSNRLEKLRGAREGRHSIRINIQWRICFIWEDGNAYRVEIVDYH
ncbi:MAG: type II toxin-antitoxin system RelE/ParE family toxin [Chloroflexi bacterium]|nr:type II toxin-antitoxin system RelE/ParE family toxin [Chloroflexota bacterium]